MWNNLHSLYLASGDLQYFWREEIRAFPWLPQVFHPELGFGKSLLSSLWLGYPFQLTTKVLSVVGFRWFAIEKILWFVTILLPIYASYRLASYLFREPWVRSLSSLIYTTNTYFLLLFGGGQLGVALAYGLSPLVILRFIKSGDKQFSLKNDITCGLLMGLLIAFDLRIAYLVVGAIVLYEVLNLKRYPIWQIVIPLIIAGTVHLYWILPTVLASNGVADLGEQFTNPGMLKFLSFADFSHALSLLHPNWPENLFGKVYFLQPEFLILPILAFSALLFIKRDAKKRLLILYFGLLSIVGVFFAKGVNDPFGGVFQWMFVHVPGFVMFRDPTKFYLFVALGYSILIPFTIEQIIGKLKTNMRRLHPLLGICFIVFWVCTIRAALLGQVGGNFKPIPLTAEYIRLKNTLVADPKPSRTLWMPTSENFAYSSETHPLLTDNDLFNNSSLSAVTKLIGTSEFRENLSRAGVKYVIVPEDLGRRMFLDNYRFDPKARNDLIAALSATTLIRDPKYHTVALFENGDVSMNINVPPEIPSQQRLADVGTFISAIMLIGWVITLHFL